MSITFSRKSYRLWDNVEKYGTARQATDDNIIRRMRFACLITKARIQTQNMWYLFLFHGNNGYANVPQCYVIRNCLSRLKCLNLEVHVVTTKPSRFVLSEFHILLFAALDMLQNVTAIIWICCYVLLYSFDEFIIYMGVAGDGANGTAAPGGRVRSSAKLAAKYIF
jgi:hypothetical protein